MTFSDPNPIDDNEVVSLNQNRPHTLVLSDVGYGSIRFDYESFMSVESCHFQYIFPVEIKGTIKLFHCGISMNYEFGSKSNS